MLIILLGNSYILKQREGLFSFMSPYLILLFKVTLCLPFSSLINFCAPKMDPKGKFFAQKGPFSCEASNLHQHVCTLWVRKQFNFQGGAAAFYCDQNCRSFCRCLYHRWFLQKGRDFSFSGSFGLISWRESKSMSIGLKGSRTSCFHPIKL